MRKINVEELKQTQLEILDVVAKFCEENQINYWIDCGTLLGAIRHKGYIPWDDDIDVGMLRPDYDKFMKLFNEKNTRYKFRCLENDPKFWLAFGKVFDTGSLLYDSDGRILKLAINIDIFPYDNAPDDDKIVEEMFNVRDSYYRKDRKHYYRRVLPIFFIKPRGNILRRFLAYSLRSMYKLIPLCFFTDFRQKMINNLRRFDNQDTKRVGNFSSITRMTCDKRVFNEFIDVEFEGRKYKAPIGYDEWLRAFYGDYMQLPPVEKRVRPHNFVAYKN